MENPNKRGRPAQRSRYNLIGVYPRPITTNGVLAKKHIANFLPQAEREEWITRFINKENFPEFTEFIESTLHQWSALFKVSSPEWLIADGPNFVFTNDSRIVFPKILAALYIVQPAGYDNLLYWIAHEFFHYVAETKGLKFRKNPYTNDPEEYYALLMGEYLSGVSAQEGFIALHNLMKPVWDNEIGIPLQDALDSIPSEREPRQSWLPEIARICGIEYLPDVEFLPKLKPFDSYKYARYVVVRAIIENQPETLDRRIGEENYPWPPVTEGKRRINVVHEPNGDTVTIDTSRLYHATPAHNVPSIMKSGLTANRLYFATSIEAAKMFAKMAKRRYHPEDEWSILQIEYEDGFPYDLVMDLIFEPFEGWFSDVPITIPSDHIKVIEEYKPKALRNDNSTAKSHPGRVSRPQYGKQYSQEGVLEDVWIDAGIVGLIDDLNQSGYKTFQSCSGLEKDHPLGELIIDNGPGGKGLSSGYISFRKSDITKEQVNNIKNIARVAGIEVMDDSKTLDIYLPPSLDTIKLWLPEQLQGYEGFAKTDKEISQKWETFRTGLLGPGQLADGASTMTKEPEVIRRYPTGQVPTTTEELTGVPMSPFPVIKGTEAPPKPGAWKQKYPRIMTMEEYNTRWKPEGWKIIFIGPTATWRQEWGEWEAIRDLVQNALDETEAYQYGYDEEGLWLADQGKGVGLSSFLLGPPKLKPDYARGKFGEGMKIASLALLRKG
ncbi:MAG: hypothetical protein PHQ43_08510, partial [Dehalococcoidales bacterium]|nr:hypothetical protein [Dehalococcoidales bacterium]